ncbi:2-succinyl-5-enolpyruvyl-6-hydroxy-3-cyclohexene-1-carboxylate synthase [Syntrophus gentianae]|uniref:2-succinyl-5-enolpyruvyl-6-hydroxy-3-cyclohexene-1-carboxylate synthase n=1 Tax=Syntrophus gentianae TaxID=43775 RepID=A0A1H8A0G0_9BACT|nr:2-succinyl-5-enolpyruvyl-6-hydroxy-3-cyclohexene-1-carboxylic-acid synthase [Syntrophus gentianae]SEM64013.1 2-succinyl-5-enolpyruvyl-6-hydroxy-3-cyclohexene-1-carboxylate synthase [Syntrophus gentianae]
MPPRPLADNLNLLWSSLIVAELVKNGLETFFISPGNRNAPLISALAREDRAVKKICIDERAAGYRALGHAKATGRPGVLVCTSGTAPANYYPAVIEAFRDEIPLVILSADRPPDLVGSDANQTIVQPDLYGRYCRDSLFLPCPSIAYPLEALLAKIDFLIAHPAGPVHINCAFRDPLVPGIPDPQPIPGELLATAERLYNRKGPYTTYPVPEPMVGDLDDIAAQIAGTSRGLVVIGRLDGPQDAEAIEGLAMTLGWPVFCDIASSLKGIIPADRQIFSLDHPEAIRLIRQYAPETILQFGSGLVSKHYYASLLPQSGATVIQICPRSGLRDPAHRVNTRILTPAHAFADGLNLQGNNPLDAVARLRLLNSLETLYSLMEAALPEKTLSFPRIARNILAEIPDEEKLFLGNSLVIRAFDTVRFPFPRKISVISNRGVSGIEGNIATSVGFAEASRRRVTAVVGDISFLHDLNSLLLLAQSATPVILIVINNGGGRIFERLPIRDFPEIIDPYMTTPHGMTFERLAAQFDLPYFQAGTPAELTRAYGQALQRERSALLEVILSPEEDLRTFTNLQKIRLP